MTKPLRGQVAIVTGASRGVGKGIALGLGEAGATVYVTGRTVAPGALPGTITETAAEVTALGGEGIAVPCDHADDAQIAALQTPLAEPGAPPQTRRVELTVTVSVPLVRSAPASVAVRVWLPAEVGL